MLGRLRAIRRRIRFLGDRCVCLFGSVGGVWEKWWWWPLTVSTVPEDAAWLCFVCLFQYTRYFMYLVSSVTQTLALPSKHPQTTDPLSTSPNRLVIKIPHVPIIHGNRDTLILFFCFRLLPQSPPNLVTSRLPFTLFSTIPYPAFVNPATDTFSILLVPKLIHLHLVHFLV